MPRDIAAATLAHLLETGSTLALIDVREHGEYNLAHIPGSSSVPRRQLEARMARLVPVRGVQVVVCDDNGRRAALAARTLERMGYTRVAVLDGGVNRWASAGLPTEWGMNVPSKDFGETDRGGAPRARRSTPRSCTRRSAQGDELVILDTRTPEEYRRFCIPGGRSAPGGELALRIHDIVREDPDADRGHQLRRAHAQHHRRARAPAHGLAERGEPEERHVRLAARRAGARARAPTAWSCPSRRAEGRAAAEGFAARVAAEDGVRFLAVDELEALMARAAEQDASI